jgi:hypothetical protein
MTQSSLEGEIDMKADGTQFNQGRGAILCLDEASRRWVKSYILTIKMEENTFRGWDIDEDSYLTTGTILLDPMFKRLEPLEVIQRAMAKADIKGDVEIKTDTSSVGGRFIRILISTPAAKAIITRGSKLPAGLSQLEFKFKDLETVQDKKVLNEADEDNPDPDIEGDEPKIDDNLDTLDNMIEGGVNAEEY